MGGGHDMRVAMPYADSHDAPKAVKIAFAGVIPNILAVALDEHNGLFVIQEDARVEELLAHRQHFIGGRSGVRFGCMATGREGWQLFHLNLNLSLNHNLIPLPGP